MCFYIIEDGLLEAEMLKAAKKPIIAYKMLNRDMRSPIQQYPTWEIGSTVVSNRHGTKLTEAERRHMNIDHGLHFYRFRPRPHPYPCPYRCLYPNPCPCPCRYLCPNGNKRWAKVSISPRSLVAINNDEVVATRCKVLEEII